MASMAEPNRKSDIPPPIIEKAGRYTVFISSPPMASPRSSPKPSPKFSPNPSPKSSLKPSPRPSKNADVEAQASPKTTQCKMPRDSFYTKVSDTINKIQNAYIRVDEVLADCFGLNQSKYQWALNEYMERKEMGTEDGKPREAVVKGQEMQQVLEQVMKVTYSHLISCSPWRSTRKTSLKMYWRRPLWQVVLLVATKRLWILLSTGGPPWTQPAP